MAPSAADRQFNDPLTAVAGAVAREPTPREAVPEVIALPLPADAMPPQFTPSRAAQRPWLLPTEPTAVPAIAADQANVGDLVVRVASVIGVGHRCEHPAQARQDAYRLAQDIRGRHLIVAVADGMSDSLRAELGAQLAVAQAIALVRRDLDAGATPETLSAQQLFAQIAGAMVTGAQARGFAATDVRTTLAIAVVPAGGAGAVPRRAWAAHVGDTSVWLCADGAWHAVTANQKDTFDGSALSTFLPYHPGAAQSVVFDVPERGVVLLATDGVADAFSEIEGADRWFAERWSIPPPLASFLLDVDFEAKGHQDDRTAAAIWCRPARRGGQTT